MKPHAFDMTSFLFGVIFGGAAAVYLLADPLAWNIDGRWVLPVALIALGVAGIAGALSSLRFNRSPADEPEPHADVLDTTSVAPGSAGYAGEL